MLSFRLYAASSLFCIPPLSPHYRRLLYPAPSPQPQQPRHFLYPAPCPQPQQPLHRLYPATPHNHSSPAVLPLATPRPPLLSSSRVPLSLRPVCRVLPLLHLVSLSSVHHPSLHYRHLLYPAPPHNHRSPAVLSLLHPSPLSPLPPSPLSCALRTTTAAPPSSLCYTLPLSLSCNLSPLYLSSSHVALSFRPVCRVLPPRVALFCLSRAATGVLIPTKRGV